MKEVLSGNQFEDRVAQVLQPLIVGEPALGVLVVVGAMGKRLAQQP